MGKSLDSGVSPAVGQEFPAVCEFVIKRNGQGYDVYKWNKTVFLIYPDSTFFIKCMPVAGSQIESLEFRGGPLRSYTTYPVKDEFGEGEVSAFIVLKEFSQGSFSEVVGEFKVRQFHEADEKPWFVGDFNLRLKYISSEGAEVDISADSLNFQVQVNGGS